MPDSPPDGLRDAPAASELAPSFEAPAVALSAAEERLRLALEIGGMGAWEWRMADGRVHWSETLERIHGLEPGTFGGTFDDYTSDIHPDDLPHVLEAVARSAAGEPHQLRYRIIRPDGAVRTLEARGTLVRDALGAPARMVGVCTDITERARAERAVQLLAEAGEALHVSLDVETTLHAVAHLAVPSLADYCVFDLVGEGEARRVAAAHLASDSQTLVAELQRHPVDLAGPSAVAEVIRTARPLLAPAWDGAVEERPVFGRPLVRVLESMGARSLLIVPVITSDARVLGAMSFVMAESGRRHDERDLRLAQSLATRAALAIDNARLHRAMAEAREQLEQQALEMELQTQQLQSQAAEMEMQQTELEQQTVELQLANDALRMARDEAEATERYVTGILGAIADPFVVHDREWRFRRVNDAAERVFARAGVGNRALLMGRVLWEVYPDIVGTRFEHELRRAQEDRVPVSFEEHYATRGTWSEVRCYPLPDGGVATMWRDITAKKHAEERLHYVARASDILSSSLDYRTTVQRVTRLLVPRIADWCVVQLVDETGTPRPLAVAHEDPAKERWAWEAQERYPVDLDAPRGVPYVLRTGRTELYADITDEMVRASARDAEHLAMLRAVGMRSVMLVPLTARDRVIGVMTLVASESGRRYGKAELELARELAQRAALAIDNARLHTASEEARRALEASRAELEAANSGLRRTNEELAEQTREAERSRAEAEAANRAKAEFLAHMSHELRTPLNAIAGYAELMALGVHGDLTPAQVEDLERIKHSQRHLLSLINDVLNFAKLEVGRVQYDVRPLVVRDVVAALDALIAPQVAARSLVYECAEIDPALVAMGDAEKVRQILLNLLSNAVKFTEPGGRITVAAEGVDGTVRISVTDTGVGIPEEKHEAIFEPFVQLDRTLSSAHQGTGLGLAISRDLARGMGGELTVESSVGEGARFVLVLGGVGRNRS